MWRVGIRWYLFALVSLPVILALGTIIVPGNLALFVPIDPLAILLTYLPFFVYSTLIIGGPLGEEPSWRRFMLHRLQRLYGPLDRFGLCKAYKRAEKEIWGSWP